MKTLGLHKNSSLHTWGLGGLLTAKFYNNIKRFKVYIAKVVRFRVSR